MGAFGGIVRVLMSMGLLVSTGLSVFGVAGGLPHAAADAARHGSYVLEAHAGARPQGERDIASPAQPVGYDAHVWEQSDPDRYVGLIEAGGADSLRDDVQWAFVEPIEGVFDWWTTDALVTESAEHHLHALLTVDTTPAWANGGSFVNDTLPPLNPAAYGQFAAEVAARYGPGGTFWAANPQLPVYLPAGLELWNEENFSSFWGGETPDPGVYAEMVAAAYSRVKAVDPGMTVVLGGLGPQGGYDDVDCTGQQATGHDASAWNGLNYLQALYGDGIQGNFDAVGWHAYNFANGTTAASMLAYTRCSAWSQMAATPVSVRSLMTANGDAAKQIWITEAGAPTCTGSVGSSPYTCVLPAQQADLATSEVQIWKTLSWAGGFYWYEIRDDWSESESFSGHFGAVSADDSPKPAYNALAQAWADAPVRENAGPTALPVAGSRGVRSVAFSPDGNFLAAGDGNGDVDVWQTGTLKLSATLVDPGSEGVRSVAFNPASSLLAAGDANGHVYLWAGGKVNAVLTVPSGEGVRSVAFSPDGTYLAAGDTAGNVYAWLVSTQGLTFTMTDPSGEGARSVAFNPANAELASADANGHSYLWTPQLAATLADPAGSGVTSVAFTPDGQHLATGDVNGEAYVWNVGQGDIAQSFADPEGKAINSVAFNPHHMLLAAGDVQGHIYLWTPAPELAANLTDPSSGGVHSVAFSPDGQYLASADTNGNVYLWPLASYVSLS
jgi:WD40 repeat protein